MKVIRAAFLLTITAASFAFPHERRDEKHSPPQTGTGQTQRAGATRFAVFDSECLAQKGVNLAGKETLAALKA